MLVLDSSKNTPAIILGLTANGLGILRCLGKENIPCYGIYHSKEEEIGLYSKYLKTSIQVPQLCNDQYLLQTLQQLREKSRHPKPFLFPTSDTFVFFIARNKDNLQNDFLFHANEMDTLTLLNDKSRTDELSNLGLPVPYTTLPCNPEDIAFYIKKAKFPSIIKPTTTAVQDFPDKVYSAKNKDELISFFQLFPHLLGKCIVQEEIPGGDITTWEVCTFSAPKQNLFIACTLHKIRQYPPDYGISSFIQTEENTRLRKIIQKAIEAIQYTGCADWEFLYYEKEDKYYLIDINCRTGMPNQICTDSGANIVKFAYNHLTKQKNKLFRSEKYIQRDDVFYLNFELDMGSFFRKWKLGQLSFVEWTISLFKARSFAFYSISDPFPWLMTCLKIPKLFFRKMVTIIKLKFF